MKKDNFSSLFRGSLLLGLVTDLTGYGCLLLCGYLLSGVLEAALAGQWDLTARRGLFTAGALVLSLLPEYLLPLLRSRRKLRDTQRFRSRLYGYLLDRRLSAENAGEVNIRLERDAGTIAGFYQDTVPKALSAGCILLCSTALLVSADWRIGLIFFFLTLTQLLPVPVYEKWARKIYDRSHTDDDAYSNWMLEGIRGIRTLKACAAEGWFLDRYERLNRAIVASGKQAEAAGTVENILFSAIDSLLCYGSYLIIGLFVLFGGLPMERTPLLLVLGGYLFSSISPVFDLRLQQVEAQEALSRLGIKPPAPPAAPGEMPLKAEYITKSYGEKTVLKDCTLRLAQGERVLLRGENGSGKSTLLRILAGLDAPDGGRLSRSVPAENIAFSLQEEAILHVSTEELSQFLIQGGTIDPNALSAHFRGFSVDDLTQKPLSDLSPGERKKLYLAMALARKGNVLILDEPTNHLDRDSVTYLRTCLERDRRAMLVCSHDPALDLPWIRIYTVTEGICHEI